MKRLLLAAAFATFAHPGFAQTPNGLRVFDSTGKVIGTYLVAAPCSAMDRCRGAVYIGSPTATGVVVPISSKGVALAQMYDGINTVSFFHASTDCSGPRLLRGRD